MKLLVDEMFPAAVAEQLRDRDHDAVSVHEDVAVAGAPDEVLIDYALRGGRAILTENVQDFRRIEAERLAAGQPVPLLIFTTNRQFPRASRRTIGSLVAALDNFLAQPPRTTGAIFLKSR